LPLLILTESRFSMSYSFNVRAATKDEAKDKAAAEFDKVVASQAIHARDREQALAAAGAFIDMVADDAERDLSVSVSGSLGWQGVTDQVITSAAVSVSVYYVKREA
jgi:hypothetical protein